MEVGRTTTRCADARHRCQTMRPVAKSGEKAGKTDDRPEQPEQPAGGDARRRRRRHQNRRHRSVRRSVGRARSGAAVRQRSGGSRSTFPPPTVRLGSVRPILSPHRPQASTGRPASNTPSRASSSASPASNTPSPASNTPSRASSTPSPASSTPSSSTPSPPRRTVSNPGSSRVSSDHPSTGPTRSAVRSPRVRRRTRSCPRCSARSAE